MSSHGAPPQQNSQTESSAPQESGEAASQAPNSPTGPDAFNEALNRVAEAREYLVYLLAVEFDRLKLKFRRLIIWAAVAVAALVVLLAILVAAVALILWGLADMIGSALGGHTWIGALIVGGGILLLGSGAIYGGMWRWNRSAFHAARRRYTELKRRQRARFGHSLDPRDD
jgi:hypothetical protein